MLVIFLSFHVMQWTLNLIGVKDYEVLALSLIKGKANVNLFFTNKFQS